MYFTTVVSASRKLIKSIFILQYKLCKVKRVQVGPKGVPFLVTNDGRTIRYPDPLIKVNDTVQVDIASGKIVDSIKFDSGNYINPPQFQLHDWSLLIICILLISQETCV